MTRAQHELEWWVRASLADLDRRAAAVRLAELAVLHLKADPGTLDLLQRARK